jgi:hypothetical protein
MRLQLNRERKELNPYMLLFLGTSFVLFLKPNDPSWIIDVGASVSKWRNKNRFGCSLHS